MENEQVVESKKESNKYLLYVVIGAIILIVVISVSAAQQPAGKSCVEVTCICNYTGQTGQTKTLDTFAKCLTASNMGVFTMSWCSYCKKQKELFGDSFQYISSVECDKDNQSAQICDYYNVTSFPTWFIKGKMDPGMKTLEELSQLSGCNL